MDIPTWIAVACLAIGTLTVLRAAFIVTINSAGRFRGDPLITMAVGVLLTCFGQYLRTR